MSNLDNNRVTGLKVNTVRKDILFIFELYFVIFYIICIFLNKITFSFSLPVVSCDCGHD